MSIYIQQGYGKANKVQDAIAANSIDGIILSPRDEKQAALKSLSTELTEQYPDINVILDPQFYYSIYPNAQSKNLNEVSYFNDSINISYLRSLRNINQVIQDCFEYQKDHSLTKFVSPNIIIPNFTDRQAQTALNMAEEASEIAKEFDTPVLISLIFSEVALYDTDSVNEFLNELSMLDVAGFYITVARNNSNYDQKFEEPTALVNLLTIIYSLSEINDYEVIMGYSDIVGILYLTVGANAIGTGWHNSSRKFTVQQRILPSTGGRVPRERYTSTPLLNSIFASELDSINELLTTGSDGIEIVLSNNDYDRILKAGPTPSSSWSRSLSHLQHWAALNQISNEIKSKDDIIDRLDLIQSKIDLAMTLYTYLDRNGIQFESATSGSHLPLWKESLKTFRDNLDL